MRFSKSKQRKIGLLICMIILISTISCQKSTQLFQERSHNWKTYGDAEWSFSDGILIGEAQDETGFVMTNGSYQDFLLELEFKPDSTINSGVFIRCAKKELSATNCHEINIWDLHPNQEYRTGAIVSKAIPKAHVETIGQWNSYRIQAAKNRIKVWVNDIQTADSSLDNPLNGYVALQAMGTGKIEFRNVSIKTLD